MLYGVGSSVILVYLRGVLGLEGKSGCYSKKKKRGLGELECEMLVMVDGWWYDKIVRGF